MPDPVLPDAATLHQAVGEACKRRTAARGSLEMPCVPALLDRHLQRILGVLQALGQPITQKEVDSLRQVLADRLREGFERSPLSTLVFEFEPPAPYSGLGDGIKVRTFIKEADLAEKYDELFQVRQEPFFGTLAPDAKVMDVAAALGMPAQSPVLDIGAASGRNSLPLAQKGHPVEALELSPAFAQSLREQAQQQGLFLQVMQGDILDPLTRPKLSYYRLAIAVGVIPHFRDGDALRLLLLKMCDVLQPGGLLLFNTFLATEGYTPDAQVRELSLAVGASVMTRWELHQAAAHLPLTLLADESFLAYEQTYNSQWLPTSWLVDWAKGQWVLPGIVQPPLIELRWLLFQRQ